MAEVVLDENEISLNAVRYPLAKPVQSVLASLYPEKLVTGDYSRESHRDLSVLALSDHRGGIGLDVMEGQGDTNRSWYSTCDIRYKGHLILPPLVTTTGTLPAGITQFYYPVAYRGEVYCSLVATSSGIYKYDDSGDTWGSRLSSVQGLFASISGMIGGSTFLIWSAGASGYNYSAVGTTYTNVTTTSTPIAMAIWDEKLWWVGLDGRLYHRVTVDGAEIADAFIPVDWFSTLVKRLFVGRDAAGNEILYVSTTQGLFAYDIANDVFHQTDVAIPELKTATYNPFGGAVTWRGSIFFTSETSIFKYDIGGGQAVLSLIGPDRDHGLPSGYGTKVNWMAPSLNDLIVGLNGTGTNKALILAWNGQGWRVLAELAASENLSPGTPIVAGAYGDYRCWFASDEGDYFKYLKLPVNIVNPLQITTYAYAAAGTHDWPWFTAGQSEVTKVAVRLKVETLNPTTAETVKVYYAINRSTTFQLMTNSTYTNGTITAAGVHTFDFPSVDSWVSTTAKVGTAFRSIQFRVVFARGSTNTNTPDVLSLTLEYYKKLDAKWGHQVDIDLTKEYKGNTPKQLRAALLTAVESSTLVEFTFRDPNTNSNATFYVQARAVTGLEQTGLDERGSAQVALVEV